jgi:hypothetical protein
MDRPDRVIPERAVHAIIELAGLISTHARSLSSGRRAAPGLGRAKGRANRRAVTIHAIRLRSGGIVCSRYDPEGPCDPDFPWVRAAFAAFLSAVHRTVRLQVGDRSAEARVVWLDLQQRLVTADCVVEPGHAVAPREIRRRAALVRGRRFCLRGLGLGGLRTRQRGGGPGGCRRATSGASSGCSFTPEPRRHPTRRARTGLSVIARRIGCTGRCLSGSCERTAAGPETAAQVAPAWTADSQPAQTRSEPPPKKRAGSSAQPRRNQP